MKNIVQKLVLSGVMISFGVGVLLLSINVFGLFLTMRNPEIYTESKLVFTNDILLTEEEFYKEFEKISDLSVKEYVYEANRIVNQGIAHYWTDDAIKKYNLRVPVWENYIMFFRSFYDSSFLKYEFCSSKKAIERGVGMCSQQALILTDILNKRGIKTNLVGLYGHVVVTSLVDDKKDEWWVLDPDYGVVLKKDLLSLESDPVLLESVYKNAGVVGIYTTDKDNSIVEGGVSAYLGEGYCRNERYDYILIWVIPIVLVFPRMIQLFYLKWKQNCRSCYFFKKIFNHEK